MITEVSILPKHMIQLNARSFRKALNLTQPQLGERMNLRREQITRTECMLVPISMKYIFHLHLIIQNDLRNGKLNRVQEAAIEVLYEISGLKAFIENL